MSEPEIVIENAGQRQLAERYALSEEARYGLHLIRLTAEGYKPRGEGTVTAQRIARDSLEALARRFLIR